MAGDQQLIAFVEQEARPDQSGMAHAIGAALAAGPSVMREAKTPRRVRRIALLACSRHALRSFDLAPPTSV